MPATTTATTPYLYRILKNVCTLSGGAYGYGYVQLKVRLTEVGSSGTFSIATLTEVQEKHGQDWQFYTQTVAAGSPPWYVDSKTHSWTSNFKYSFNQTEATTYFHRVSMTLHFSGFDDTLLAETWLFSKEC